MPISAKCPTCEHSYNVPDGQRGKRVRCRNCADIFVVGESKGRGKEDDEIDDVVLENDPEESPRKRKKAPGDAGDLRSRLDREDLKPKGRKRSPDRDDDDDDDRPRRKKSGEGSLLPLLLGIGGVVLLLLIGGAFAVYWSMSRVVQAGENLVDNARQDIIRQQQNNPAFNPPPGIFNPPVVIEPPGPVRRSVFVDPKNIDEALEDINLQFNDAFVPKARAEWLTKQEIEEGRRQEVCDALWKVSQNNPHHFAKEAGTNGFCKWAGPAQGDRLLQLVEAGNGKAMEAAVQLKLPNLAAALCKKLTDWHARGHVMRHLEDLGPKAAEKDVLVFLNHSDDGIRRDVTNLLKKWDTKTDVIVDQCVIDLASTKMEIAKAALQRLSELNPDDTTRKPAVVKAVRPLMVSTQRDIDRLAIAVALKWGTAELAPDLIAALEAPGNSFDKRKLMEALKDFNTEACRQAIVKQLATPGVNFQASAIIRAGGDAYEPAVLEFLRTANNPLQRMEAVRLLEVVGTLKSMPMLQQVAIADRSMQLWATKAAQAIQKRGK